MTPNQNQEIFDENSTLEGGVGATLAYVALIREKAANLLAIKDTSGATVRYIDPEKFIWSESEKAVLLEYLRIEYEMVKARKESIDWAAGVDLDGEILLSEMTREIACSEKGEEISRFDSWTSEHVLEGTVFRDNVGEKSDINSLVDGYQNMMDQAHAENVERSQKLVK